MSAILSVTFFLLYLLLFLCQFSLIIMATVNLYLDKPNSNKKTKIYIRVFYNGKRFKISTGESILPSHWNPNKQIVKKSYNASMELNNLLQSMKQEVNSLIRTEIALKKEIIPQKIKDSFNITFRDKKKYESFFQIFDEFINSGKSKFSETTIIHYKSTENKLKEFELFYKTKIDFDKMNLTFYDKFLHYLVNELSLKPNTVGFYIKTLKAFLNYANQRGYFDNTEYKKFKVIREEVDIIYMTEKDLKKLNDCDLSWNKKLEKIRDLFLLQCYTGLRFSDLKQLKPENTRNGKIKIETKKTHNKLSIPIISSAQAILDKYPDLGNNKITNRQMNEDLKVIGKLAGINEMTVIQTHQNNQRIEKIVPKYKLITTHTGRRTFVTLSLEKGMRAETVMKITGHKDMRSFRRYIKLTEKVVEEEMKHFWD